MPSASPQGPYILVTSAYNEHRYIEATIRSVVNQTMPPMAWAIVSDGSTDGTDNIVKHYAALHDFIRYVRVEHSDDEIRPKYFAVAHRKVNALASGLRVLSGLRYAYVGNIDADTSVEPSFFAELIRRFENDPRLGLGGGYIYNVIRDEDVPAFVSSRNVGGALQLFRRQCFEEIGGYASCGHEDTIALVRARMEGWTTRSFADLKVLHHKTAGWTGLRRCRSKYRLGVSDYIMNDSLLWVLLRCLKELRETPPVVGSVLRLSGYLAGLLTETKSPPPEVQRFVRQEQYRLMKEAFLGK